MSKLLFALNNIHREIRNAVDKKVGKLRLNVRYSIKKMLSQLFIWHKNDEPDAGCIHLQERFENVTRETTCLFLPLDCTLVPSTTETRQDTTTLSTPKQVQI